MSNIDSITTGPAGPLGNTQDIDLAFAVPTYRKWQSVSVKFGKPRVLESFAETLVQRVKGTPSIAFDYTKKTIVDYLMTVVGLRIHQVREGYVPREYPRYFAVPGFMATYVQLIGRAVDDVLGVELMPELSDQIKMLSPIEFREVSNAFRALTSIGVEYATELPRQREGDWSFMMFENVKGQLASHEQKPAHASYALAASFVEMEQIGDIFNAVLYYGPSESFVHVVDALVR